MFGRLTKIDRNQDAIDLLTEETASLCAKYHFEEGANPPPDRWMSQGYLERTAHNYLLSLGCKCDPSIVARVVHVGELAARDTVSRQTRLVEEQYGSTPRKGIQELVVLNGLIDVMVQEPVPHAPFDKRNIELRRFFTELRVREWLLAGKLRAFVQSGQADMTQMGELEREVKSSTDYRERIDHLRGEIVAYTKQRPVGMRVLVG